jgi:NAD(P)-dependent dehydrogenase (short-subunit alcohol dehydrogenase family)
MDVTQEVQVTAAVAATVAKFKHLDVAVNCAGVGDLCRIVDLDVNQWDMVVDIDLRGTFLSVKHEATQMITQGDGGSIINIASLNSRQPAEGMVTYCTSKAGVEMLTKVAAMELGPHKIRVNAISPGLIDTPLTNPLLSMSAVYKGFLENTPLGRSGTTDDIAAAVAFLASDESTWITGENIFIDGGALTKRYPELEKLMMEG